MSRRRGTNKQYRNDIGEIPRHRSSWKQWVQDRKISEKQLLELGINSAPRRIKHEKEGESSQSVKKLKPPEAIEGMVQDSSLTDKLSHGMTSKIQQDESAIFNSHPGSECGNVSGMSEGMLSSPDSEKEVIASDVSDIDVVDSDNADGRLMDITPELESPVFGELNQPLTSTLSITKFETLLMLLHITMKYDTTFKLMEDLVGFLNRVVGVPNAIPESKDLIFKLFMGDTKPIVNFYCPNCEIYLGPSSVFPTGAVVCNQCDLLETVSDLNDGNYFLTLHIRDQIKEVLQKPHVKLVKRRGSSSERIVADYIDGKVYKTLLKDDGILSNPNSLTITFAANGNPVFKNEGSSLWPLCFYLNELHPSQRFCEENVLLAGLWYGKSKPKMNIYLQPFIEHLKELGECGIVWTKPDGVVVESPVYALCCCTDSVSKAQVQNSMLFDGSFGCGYCVHPNNPFYIHEKVGTRFRCTGIDNGGEITQPVLQKRKLMRYLRGNHPSRKSKEMRYQMKIVSQSPVHHIVGVTGMSILYDVSHFDMVFGFGIDYVQVVLLGVVKSMTNLWFDSACNGLPYYSGGVVDIVDKRLSEISVSRKLHKPRSITDRYQWTVNEWREFLLYYGLPCLYSILPVAYYNHFKKLVTAIYLLTRESILYEEVDAAHKLLQNFVWEYQDLYGESNMFYHVHVTGHLAKYVSKMGPLWCYSSYPFESAKSRLNPMPNEVKDISMQIAHRFSMTNTTSKLIRKKYVVKKDILDYCSRVIGFNYLQNSGLCNDQGKIVHLNKVQKQAITARKFQLIDKVVAFDKAVISGTLYHAMMFLESSKAADCCVSLCDGDFALIELFFKADFKAIGGAEKMWCFVKKLNIEEKPSAVIAPHIKVCRLDPFGATELIDCNDILRVCMFFPCSDKFYVSELSNPYEAYKECETFQSD